MSSFTNEENINLVGKYLVGIDTEFDLSNYDSDNAIVLITGKYESPIFYLLRSQNMDWSMYDHWVLSQLDTHIVSDEFKAINSEITEFKVFDNEISMDDWTDEGKDNYWVNIKAGLKEIRLGHQWIDCHYPNSIWELI